MEIGRQVAQWQHNIFQSWHCALSAGFGDQLLNTAAGESQGHLGMSLSIDIRLKVLKSQNWQVIEEPITPNRPALRGAQQLRAQFGKVFAQPIATAIGFQRQAMPWRLQQHGQQPHRTSRGQFARKC